MLVALAHEPPQPLAFDTGDQTLVPALPTAWMLAAAGDRLPTLSVHEQTAPYVLGGAPLMLPGVRAVDARESLGSLEPGRVVCVAVQGNPHAFAVGRLLVSGEALAAQLSAPGSRKGGCVEVLHTFGDWLWRSFSMVAPPGFAMTEEGVHVRVLAPEDGDGAANADSGDAEAAPGTARPSSASAPEADTCTGGATPDQDALLRSCFLQAARTIKDKALPLELNDLYANYMRPMRPAGSSLDVKRSSHRKLVAFMRSVEAAGLCELGAKGGKDAEPKLVSICRSAPEYRAHVPWSTTAASAEAAASSAATGAPPLSFRLLYRPTNAQRSLFPADSKAMYDEVEVAKLVEAHVARLLDVSADGSGGGTLKPSLDVHLDPVLHDALFLGATHDPKDPFQEWPTVVKLGWLQKRLVCRLEPWTRVAGGQLAKPLFKQGRAPSLLSVRTEKRSNHLVTLVAGMDALGIEAQQLASELATVAGASTTVEQIARVRGPPVSEVMVQGLRDRTVVELLSTRYGVPQKLVDNQAQGRKGMHEKVKRYKIINK